MHIISTENELQDFKKQWCDLWGKVKGASYSQTFQYCKYSWQVVSENLKARLHCIAIFDDTELVLIWPLIRYNKGPITLLRPLSPNADGFSDPLVIGGDKAKHYVAEAWQVLTQRPVAADILKLIDIKSDRELYKIISNDSANRIVGSSAVPYVNWDSSYKTWDHYYNTLSGRTKNTQNRRKRQLANAGALSFDIITDKASFPNLINWLMKEKRKWAANTQKQGWALSEEYEKFLIQLSQDHSPVQSFVMFTLSVDSKILSVKFTSIGSSHMEWIMSGFSEEYSRMSPGNVLNEMCLHWAFDRKLDCDLGPGVSDYKLFWSKKAVSETFNYERILTKKGQVIVALIDSYRVLVDKFHKYKASDHQHK